MMHELRAAVDDQWLREAVAASTTSPSATSAVARLRALLKQCAKQFAVRRTDVVAPTVVWPRRGLLHDESSGFLRALDGGFVDLDDAGYFTIPVVRPKSPAGRYALLSKSGDGVSVNLEYLIQVGATAELVLDHGWPAEAIDFERGEFDALCSGPDGKVVLAMEAKARVTGPDSLESLVVAWLRLVGSAEEAPATNAGRKLHELVRLTERGGVLVWLVADGARWAMWAGRVDGAVTLLPASTVERTAVLNLRREDATVLEAHPYDPALHRPGTAAHDGHCSWHGPVSCAQPPVISFRDAQGKWQSGCHRAVDELRGRGELRLAGQPEDGPS